MGRRLQGRRADPTPIVPAVANTDFPPSTTTLITSDCVCKNSGWSQTTTWTATSCPPTTRSSSTPSSRPSPPTSRPGTKCVVVLAAVAVVVVVVVVVCWLLPAFAAHIPTQDQVRVPFTVLALSFHRLSPPPPGLRRPRPNPRPSALVHSLLLVLVVVLLVVLLLLLLQLLLWSLSLSLLAPPGLRRAHPARGPTLGPTLGPSAPGRAATAARVALQRTQQQCWHAWSKWWTVARSRPACCGH